MKGTSERWRRSSDLGALLLALAPLALGAWWLHGMVPPADAAQPAHRVLTLTRGDGTWRSVRAAAERHPGRAALPLAALGAPLALESLPFDEVRWERGTAPAAPPAGYRFVSEGVARRERAPWSPLDSWPRWEVRRIRDGRPVRCRERLPDGGHRCGGPRVIPDVRSVGGALRGVIHVSGATAGDRIEIRVPDDAAPEQVDGRLFVEGPGLVVAEVARGARPEATRCAADCALGVPAAGGGDLVVTVVGPAPPLSIELWGETP